MNESAWTLIGFAVVMVIVIAGLSMISQHYTLNIKSRTVGDGQHGTARWATKQEIHRTYHLVRFDTQAWRRGKDQRRLFIIICEERPQRVWTIHAWSHGYLSAGK